MILLRTEQIAAIKLPQIMLLVNLLCRQARENYDDVVEDMQDGILRKNVLEIIRKAERYRFITQQDCSRFLIIALEYGWDFDEDPENDWMIKMLNDSEISSPSQRLVLLLEECIYRQEVAEHNIKIREEFYRTAAENFDKEELDGNKAALLHTGEEVFSDS